jgi:hypothetical protein
MKQSTVLKILFLIPVLILQVHHDTAAQISNPDGELRTSDRSQIWAQTLTGSYFNEFWNYQFYFDDGTKAHIIFSVANFGSLKSPVSGVRLSVLYPNGDVKQLSREYPIERLVQDRDNHMFRLHPERDIYFQGNPDRGIRIVINTTKDGVHFDVDLKLTNIATGYQLGDAKFTIHNEQIGIITHIPYAEVSGSIAVDNRRRNVSGTGYMDHTWQNQTTTRLMKSGYRYIYHRDAGNWDILYFLLPENNRNNRTVGYRLSSTDGDVSIKAIEQITNMHQGRAFGTSIPRIVEIKFNDGTDARLSRNEDQERFSILGELGWVARRAARTFLGGEVIDFRGEATLQVPSERPKNGDYNFFIVN